MKHIALVVSLLVSFSTLAQVINAESLRKVTDTSGFSGSAGLELSLKRDVNDKFSIKNTISLQYKMRRHLVLLKNDIEFQKIENNNFENKGVQHLRYNYKLYPQLVWEVFGQAQYNKISKIRFRGLVGMGPRFKLTKLENYKLYLGTLIMYEHQELSDGVTPVERIFRGSAYFSFSLFPTETLSISSTTYYQPRLNKFSDFRIASETSLMLTLYRNFSFKTTYTFTFDDSPAINIPNSQYELTSGIVYSFD
ncbi:DUF481 domain-containing protein [Aequorivita marina]|uniref:DUF481 domain-containing protein n=1 Tax=Aequorivita marina TaxID=3073654 RepID=UPI002875D79D|nr:DUF481 domain-containing protein [Aequorivita sp. S2608]MDS1298412.1 DUF481 domain-containing protein [Aequorivita sp. S2608]